MLLTRSAAKLIWLLLDKLTECLFFCFGYFHCCDRTTATLQAICKEYYERLCKLESEKYDTEYLVRQKDYEVSDMTSPVPPRRHPRAKEKKKNVPNVPLRTQIPLYTAIHWSSFSLSFPSLKLDCKLNVFQLLRACFLETSFKAAENEANFTEPIYTIPHEMTVLLQQYVPTHNRQWSVTCWQSSFASAWKLCHSFIHIFEGAIPIIFKQCQHVWGNKRMLYAKKYCQRFPQNTQFYRNKECSYRSFEKLSARNVAAVTLSIPFISHFSGMHLFNE